MNVGIFAGIIILENSGFRFNLVELKNLAFANSFFTLAFSICIFALAGFPITSGFVAKIYLFSAIAHSGVIFIPFLIILFVAITIAAFYYFKIIKFLFQKFAGLFVFLILHQLGNQLFCRIRAFIFGGRSLGRK